MLSAVTKGAAPGACKGPRKRRSAAAVSPVFRASLVQTGRYPSGCVRPCTCLPGLADGQGFSAAFALKPETNGRDPR